MIITENYIAKVTNQRNLGVISLHRSEISPVKFHEHFSTVLSWSALFVLQLSSLLFDGQNSKKI